MPAAITNEERIKKFEKSAELKIRLDKRLKKEGMNFFKFTQTHLIEIGLSYYTLNGMMNGRNTMRSDVEGAINDYLAETTAEKF